MKYRIIQTTDGNNESIYHIERYCKFLWWKWWKPLTKAVDAGCDVGYVTRTFGSKISADRYLGTLIKTSTVVREVDIE